MTSMLKKTFSALVWISVVSMTTVVAQEKPQGVARYQPSAENEAQRAWFRDARFGLFVHWGIYANLGSGEWVMENRPISSAAYERVADHFYPHRFDAREWVRLVKQAGMRYITITAKHHDGFAMYDSAASDWDIVDRTPFGRDILAELAEACREEGIKLFFYYSQLDWHHGDYYPLGRTGHAAGRAPGGDFDTYIDFMNAQLTELLTGYGEVGGIWFDGMWDRPDAEWRLEETYALIHRLQPGALVGSNHHQTVIPGEDFQMFERDLPGQNTAGWNDTAISRLPLETAETINGSWGYSLTDTAFKSADDIIRLLVGAAGRDANLLLNVGPMPDGRIQPEFEERLRAVGEWLDIYGDTIYGTRGGPIPAGTWGVSTRKEAEVFLHLLGPPQRAIAVEWDGDDILSITRFEDDTPVEYSLDDGVLLIRSDPVRTGKVNDILRITIR